MSMEILELLRRSNPGLPLFCVTDPAFAPYGRVLDLGGRAAELAELLEATPIPEEGNIYQASDEGLERAAAIAPIRRSAFGEMPVQAGFCNGRGHTLNAMEYHRCSEVNFSTTGLVLLLALPGQLRDGFLESSEVVGFYLPPELCVEIRPLVLHFAPCRVRDGGFNCLVVLERGTNSPIEGVDPTLEGEEKLLWMRNKWLTCHPDSPQAKKGAFRGIRGENIDLAL